MPQAEGAKTPGLRRKLLREFRQHARFDLLVPAALVGLFMIGASTYKTMLTKELIDLAVRLPRPPFADFVNVAGKYFVVTLITYGGLLRVFLFQRARADMTMAMRKKLFRSLLNQEVAFFEANKSGELVSRLANDTQQMQDTLNGAPEALVTSLLQCLVALVFMGKQHVKLTLACVFPLPIATVVSHYMGKARGRYQTMENDAYARMNAVASEATVNHRAVQIAGAEGTEDREYSKVAAACLAVVQNNLLFGTGLSFLSHLVNDLFTDVPMMFFAIFLIWRGDISIGQFYMHRQQLFYYRRGFRELANLIMGVERAKAVSTRYFELLDRTPVICSPVSATPLDRARMHGALELDGVSFQYPGQDIHTLHDVSLSVKPGELVALVGPSGSGKSTIIRLCARLIDPDLGAVRLDGQDLRQLDLRDLRKSLAVVDQTPGIFDRSVVDNIVYGLYDDEAVGERESREARVRAEAAARAAHAEGFIAALPQAYGERLGENGSRLSGGQKQRLALARALARNAKVLLLDEPTSALDGESEEAVADLLRTLADEGRAVLVAAHRLGTVARADRVIVLEGGRVVEAGRREELLARPKSRYKSVVEPGLAL